MQRRPNFRRRRPPNAVNAEVLEDRLPLAADFTVALLPDTQIYTEQFPQIFESQTQWLAANAASENIAFVSHVGDVVDHADSSLEWQRADAAMDTLDGVVPYSVLPGNHDFSPGDTHGNADQFKTWFGTARYDQRSWYGGSSSDQLNHYQHFSGGGYDFLHLALEWEPRPTSAAWAQQILNAHPTTPTILTTHAYLDDAGGRFTDPVTTDGIDGEQIYQQIVRSSPQIFLVMNGHFSGEDHQLSFNDAGLPVFEMMANYQSRANGGDGWLQLLRFRPDADAIDVTTYSPTLDQFETDSDSQFSFHFDFASRFDLAGPPTVALSVPQDNGSEDADPAAGTVRVLEAQAGFVLQLSDITPGIDDGTVIPHTVQLTKDGAALVEGSDYSFAYNATTDQIELTSLTGGFNGGDYQITLNSGAATISDEAGQLMPVTSLAVQIDETLPPPPDTLYFSVNSRTTLTGGLTVDSDDIVYWDGSDFTLHFDGSDVGLDSETIDALAVLNADEVLLSFTQSLYLPGISKRVDDSDVVKFTAAQFGPETSGSFSMYLDGSDVGLTTSDEDVNALAVLPDGDLLISTRGPVSVAGVTSVDEDLIRFTPTQLGEQSSGSWSMYLDGSDLNNFAGEDIYGVTAYPTGDFYLTLSSSFSTSELSAKDEDVFSLSPSALGEQSAGEFAGPPFFDGSTYGLSGTDVYSVHVPIGGAINRPPVAEDDTADVAEGQSIQIDVLADNGNGPDSDVDGQLNPAATTIVSFPEHGQLIDQGTGSFTYTPAAAFYGIDRFTYTVADDQGAVSNVATVTISVTADAQQYFYFALDRSHTFANNLSVANEDVVAFDGTHLTKIFDGSDVGMGSEKLNSFSWISPTEILMSFSSDATVPGVGLVTPRDIVRFDASQLGETTDGTFSLYFVGANVGLDSSGEAIDGLKLLPDGRLLLSTRSSFSVHGISGYDEDLLQFTPTALGSGTAGSWQLYFDGSDVQWSGHDVDAMSVDEFGRIYLSPNSDLTFSIGPIADEDVVVFTPASLGGDTSGTYDAEPAFDGSNFALNAADIKAIDVTSFGPQFLQTSATYSAAQPLNTAALTTADARTLLPEARQLLQTDGLTAPAVDLFVDELPGDLLGLSFGSMIILDRDAAGWGWQLPDGGGGAFDPVHVLAHELGHAAGLDHADHRDLMHPVLHPNIHVPADRSAAIGQLQRPDPFRLPDLDAFWAFWEDPFELWLR